MNTRTSVDTFMRFNTEMADEPTYKEPTALYSVMDIDEFEDVYGLTNDDDTPGGMGSRGHIYYRMEKNPDKVVILYECQHYHEHKHRHHPSYDKPFEVELLCPSCHSKRHREVSDQVFKWIFHRNHKAPSPIPQNAMNPQAGPSGVKAEREALAGLVTVQSIPRRENQPIPMPECREQAAAVVRGVPRYAEYHQLSFAL